ncbi:MAG TPA: proton-conducting transporter membrane subunit [Anaerolineae bacterium]|nr:proton-conducting transporter membrane subunit [Anaerolineae bacterium]
MSLLLLVFLPLVMAGPVYFMRRYWALAVVVSLATILALLGICIRYSPAEPAYLLGRELVLGDLQRFLLAFFCLLAGLMVLYAWREPQGWAFLPSLLAILGLVNGAMMIETFLIAVLLLEMAGLVFVFMMHGRGPAPTGTVLGYLVAVVVAAPCLLLVAWLVESYALQPEDVLLVRFTVIAAAVGFGILLAAAPFHSWLPPVAGDASPMAAAVLICVLGPVSLYLLLGVLRDNLWLVTGSPILWVISIAGLLTALIGGVLAFAQREPGRLMGYAAISDMGFVLVGLGAGSALGTTAALAHTVNRSLAVLLLAMSLGSLRSYVRRRGAHSSTLRQALGSAPGGVLGYVAGGLAIGGFPLFNGFATRWLVYRSLTQDNALFMGVLVLAGVGVVLGCLRSLSFALRTSSDADPGREPLPVTALILLLVILCLVLGLFPGLLVNPLQSILQAMAPIGAGV